MSRAELIKEARLTNFQHPMHADNKALFINEGVSQFSGQREAQILA